MIVTFCVLKVSTGFIEKHTAPAAEVIAALDTPFHVTFMSIQKV
jgi:hypothetical protein